MTKRFAFNQLPAVLFAVAIFLGSSIPGPQLPSVVFQFSDKFLHVCEYAVFSFLLYRALKNQTRMPGVARAAFLLAILAACAYAATDEFHQSFVPGRTMDVFDWLADSIGAALGTSLAAALGAARARTRRS